MQREARGNAVRVLPTAALGLFLRCLPPPRLPASQLPGQGEDGSGYASGGREGAEAWGCGAQELAEELGAIQFLELTQGSGRVPCGRAPSAPSPHVRAPSSIRCCRGRCRCLSLVLSCYVSFHCGCSPLHALVVPHGLFDGWLNWCAQTFGWTEEWQNGAMPAREERSKSQGKRPAPEDVEDHLIGRGKGMSPSSRQSSAHASSVP